MICEFERTARAPSMDGTLLVSARLWGKPWLLAPCVFTGEES